MNIIYLDNSATTKQYNEVTEQMLQYMTEHFGNPSSLHRLGMTVEKAMRQARRAVAESLSHNGLYTVNSEEIYFTSGGTESDNTAIFGAAAARRRRGKKIITSAVEHPAALEACKRLESRGYEIVYIDVDKQCGLNMEQLHTALDQDTILISIMQVNNETGTIMPIEEIANIKDAYNLKNGTDILLHTDAVQSFGKIKIPLPGIDLISVSGHKIHGPKGIGALYIRKGLTIEPFIVGGGQERHFRSGTENVPAIMGFGKAVELASSQFKKRTAHMQEVRNYLMDGIKEQITDVKINGIEQCEFCCPSILNLSFMGTRGEVLLHSLEQDGIYVSTGAACASNKKGSSHVLTAMGLNEKEIEGALRFSFSEFNTIQEMQVVLEKLTAAVSKFRKLGSFR